MYNNKRILIYNVVFFLVIHSYAQFFNIPLENLDLYIIIPLENLDFLKKRLYFLNKMCYHVYGDLIC